MTSPTARHRDSATPAGVDNSQSGSMDPSTNSTRYVILATTCLLLVAFGVRFFQLAAQSLWEDEIFSAIQATLPVAEMLRWTAGDIHPPGYYLLMGGLARLFGWLDWPPSLVTDWLWRCPSALAGTLAVAVTYRLGADWFARRVGLPAALLLALSPVAVRYSQEARMHELFLLFAALSTWTLTRALATQETRTRYGWWLGYTGATIAGLYTVYLGFVVLVVQATWVGLTWMRRRRARSAQQAPWCFLPSAAVALTAYVPWWPVVIDMLRLAMHSIDTASGVGPLPEFALRALTSLGPGEGMGLWLGLALWAIGVAAAGRHRLDLAVLGGLWIALPVTLSAAFHDPRALHMRYAFLLPVYLVFVAHGASVAVRRLRARMERRWAYTAIVAILTVASVLSLPDIYSQTKTDWRATADYLAGGTRPGDVIVHDPLFDTGRYLGYYYRGPAEIATPAVLVASLPQRLPGMRASGGRVWAVTRFEPRPVAAMRPAAFPGLIISEPLVPVYEPEILTVAMVDLMQQAVDAAPNWATRVTAEGIMAPDPHAARAAGYLFLGDVLRVAGRLPEAIAAYEAMIADAPTATGFAALAEAYQDAGRDEAAVAAYQQAVARQPKWQGPAAGAAAELAAAGQWSAAASSYHAIIFPQPSNP